MLRPPLSLLGHRDVEVMVDGSGSVEWTPGGFREEQMFTEKLFSLLDFGDEGAKARPGVKEEKDGCDRATFGCSPTDPSESL